NEVIDGIGYTGHVMDPMTGLTYMQQRYYDPAIGRFLSVDPVRAHRGSGANFNRYRYAANNPYRFTDPDGRLQKDKIEQPLPPPPPTLPPVEVTAPKPATASTAISIPMPIPASPLRLPKINVTALRPAPWFLLLVWPSELGAPACEMPGGPPCGLGVYNESEPSETELTKVKESDGNKVAQDAGYEDAHDAKKGRGEGGVDIYRDRSGRHWLWNGVPGGGKEEL
ncbi:MAG: RHS repeat-associated core domain-containing protein, partial [Polynucleobacter sp.]|nr:RHS repeat-associated core domain-containing protein [Polynucleobacter sp.]